MLFEKKLKCFWYVNDCLIAALVKLPEITPSNVNTQPFMLLVNRNVNPKLTASL